VPECSSQVIGAQRYSTVSSLESGLGRGAKARERLRSDSVGAQVQRCELAGRAKCGLGLGHLSSNW
jgi:hypothetical protein